MKEVISFIKDYWQLILAAIVFILSFILQLIKKKPISNIMPIIYDLAIQAINDTEVYSMVDPNVKGADKLDHAVRYVQNALCHAYPNLDFKRYYFLIEKVIEGILSTPQKKG